MKKVTQKFIKNYNAQDITNKSFEELQTFHKNLDYTVTHISCGIYGMNGAILQDSDGFEYKITDRNSALFQMV